MSPTLRRPKRTLDALPRMGGKLVRLIGSTDACGDGTTFAVPDLGPFILIEDARGIDGPDQPPFGPHPHAGLLVASYAAEGGPWHSWANAAGSEEVDFGAGDVVLTCAGRGIRHDERSVGEGDHAMTQIILRLPKDQRARPASVRKHRVAQLDDRVRRLFDGADLSDYGLDAAFHHVALPPDETATIWLSSTHSTGFVYVRNGALRLGEAKLKSGQIAILEAEGEAVALEAGPDGGEALLGTGAPLDEPWAKRLGHDGFVVANDVAEAEALLAAYADDPEGFGQR